MDVDSEQFVGSDCDSDAELQEAFALGLLKPGLNIEEDPNKKGHVNDKAALKLKLHHLKLNLPWIERLDLTSVPAPMGPELTAKIEQRKEDVAKGKICDLVLNDFEREMTFYRQAQTAVIEGISRLKELNVFTKRPADYFAEMAKSDKHMQKIRGALIEREAAQARSEKVRQIRQLRRINRELQRQSAIRKESEKKEFLDQVKMYRKKLTDNLDFLDNMPKPKVKIDLKAVKKPLNRRAQRKKALIKAMKKYHYGYGGKKKGMKRNTKESSFGVANRKNMFKPCRKGKPTLRRMMNNTRPGKGQRMEMKNKGGGKK